LGAPDSLDGLGAISDTFAAVHPEAADPQQCPSYGSTDTAAQSFLLAHPEVVRSCGYTAGWAKDDNALQCEVLSLCTAWETRRDTSVRIRIDMVLQPVASPFSASNVYVPNRSDADWAIAGAEWYRLSDHLPYIVDLVQSAP
ncbi:MAG: hypothetical protein ACKOYM_04840, partial [Actinomycetes bacterium]